MSCGEDDETGVQEELKKLTISDQGTALSENDSKEDEFQDNLAKKDNDRDSTTSIGSLLKIILRSSSLVIHPRRSELALPLNN